MVEKLLIRGRGKKAKQGMSVKFANTGCGVVFSEAGGT